MVSVKKLSHRILKGALWNISCHPLRLLLLTILLTTNSLTSLLADEVQFTNAVKASLKFTEKSNPKGQYPHLLVIHLCLENRRDADVRWICNYDMGVEGELLDSKGRRVVQPPQVGGGYAGYEACKLGRGQRREWLIGGNASMSPQFPDSPKTDLKKSCAVVIGAQGWLIPRKSLSSYSLKLRIKGWPWTNDMKVACKGGGGEATVLFEVPPTAIVIK